MSDLERSEDSKGTLWIGTWGGGLHRLVLSADAEGFDPETLSFARYQADPADPSSLSNNGVMSIYEDRQGALWIGTVGGGLDRFDRESESFVH